jgi:hypothetical protein
MIEKKKFITTLHASRKGWKDEYDAIIKGKRCMDKKKVIDHKNYFEMTGVPEDMPVCQNKFLGRSHDVEFEMLALETLSQIFRHSERDQLGLVYAMYKTGTLPSIFEEGRILFTAFSKNIDLHSACFIQSISMYECFKHSIIIIDIKAYFYLEFLKKYKLNMFYPSFN